jgi:ankyrin repeat protein
MAGGSGDMGGAQRCFELLQAGDSDGLLILLDGDPACAEARDSSGVSLTMWALYRGQRDLAETIAARKKSLDIFEAASFGRLDRLKALAVDRSRLNSYSADGFTALHFACFFGPGATVDAIAANPMKLMPLHSAASSRNLEAVRHLLEHGAPVNARQQGGWLPIHAAAQNGDRPMVELLLQHGADAKLANDDGKTAVMVAREKGHEELAALLESAK